jgi:hypothetical protein
VNRGQQLRAEHERLVKRFEEQRQRIEFLGTAVNAVISVDDQREELARIEADPREAAVGYLKLLR